MNHSRTHQNESGQGELYRSEDYRESANFPESDENLRAFQQTIKSIAIRPPLIALLHFVGYSGVATHTQMFQFLFRDMPHNEAMEWITMAMRMRYVNPIEVKAPRKSEQVVMYLTDDGLSHVKKYDKKMAAHLVSGALNTRRKKNCLHDLVIAGSILEWRKEYDVIWFQTEGQIRSEKMSQRHRESGLTWRDIKTFIPSQLSDDSMGDYRVAVHHRTNKTLNVFECEAAVKYKTDAIAGKPIHLKWFVSSEYQHKRIWRITGNKGVIVTPFLDKPPEKTTAHIRNNILRGRLRSETNPSLTALEQDILDKLTETNMCMSVTEMTYLIGRSRDDYHKTEWARRNLLKQNLIYTDKEKALSWQRGRPNFYMYLPQNENFLTANVIFRHALLGQVLVREMENGWSFSDFDLHSVILTMEKDGHFRMFVADTTETEHRSSTVRTYEKYKKFTAENPHSTQLVVTDPVRLSSLLDSLAEEEIYDLSRNDGWFLRRR